MCKAVSGGESLMVNGTVHILVIGSLGPLIISLLSFLMLIAFFVSVISQPSLTSYGSETRGCIISLNSCASFPFVDNSFAMFHSLFAIDNIIPLLAATTFTVICLLLFPVAGPK